jgi:hypothetical protein
MAQATSNNSITEPVVSTRRRFISQAAGAAAGGTALALATIPPASAAAPPVSSLDPDSVHPDAVLLELEEKIFDHKHAADEFGGQSDQLDSIYTAANWRLHNEFEATGSPTFDERKAIVEAMPEFEECMRLRELQQLECDAADGLVERMWAIKAVSAEGRRSKLLVLLSYVMADDEWRAAKEVPHLTSDVTRARDLMIEFVGGEPSEQLRDQFV